jgi:hypothetical protein
VRTSLPNCITLSPDSDYMIPTIVSIAHGRLLMDLELSFMIVVDDMPLEVNKISDIMICLGLLDSLKCKNLQNEKRRE